MHPFALALAFAPLMLPSGDAGIVGTRAVDLDGRIRKLGMQDGLAPVVLVFLDPECPVSKRYGPRLGELAREAAAAKVELYGVLSDPALSTTAARAYRGEHALAFPLLFDSAGDLAQRLAPTHVPEAFVVGADDQLVYRGRIDDRFESVGTLRAETRAHDLLDALRAAGARGASGAAVELVRTTPVGCVFEAWKAPSVPTYARAVAPLLDANCVECHRDGDIAPFALQDHAQAARRARTIAEVVARRVMPPWRAVPGHGEFRDERVLSAAQITTLEQWAAAGAPAGDPAERLPAPVFPTARWRLGEPDLVVELPGDFPVPADGDDVYRYFVVPSPLGEERALVAADFRPGDPAVVHHCLAYVDRTGWMRGADERDPGLGFSVFGKKDERRELDRVLLQAETIAGWAPGSEPSRLPRGLGQRLASGGDFVLEVHYHPNGKATTDRSQLGLYFADAPVERWVEGLVIGTERIDIPAGESAYRRHVWMEFPADVELIDVTPHMHFLGKEFEAAAELPDGTLVDLLRIDDWDFRWQSTYAYRAPVRLPAGTVLEANFLYDNSAANPANPSSPPQRVQEGWRTTDEMCLFYFSIVPADPRTMERIHAAMGASFARSGAPE